MIGSETGTRRLIVIQNGCVENVKCQEMSICTANIHHHLEVNQLYQQ